MKHVYTSLTLVVLLICVMKKSVSSNSTRSTIDRLNRYLCALKYCSGAHGPNDDGTCRLDVTVTDAEDKSTQKSINKMTHIHTCCFAQLNNNTKIVGVGCYDSCHRMDPYLVEKPECTKPAHLASIGPNIDVTIFCRKADKPCDQLEEIHDGENGCCELTETNGRVAVVCDGNCPYPLPNNDE